MPELPEVETVRRGLAPVMEGWRFARVTTRRKDLRFPLPARFRARLEGAMLERLDRRGKYMICALDTGEHLIMHLGMSGRFTIHSGQTDVASEKHDHVMFEMNQGANGDRVKIIYNDARRFGFMDLAEQDALESSRHFKGMGPEPMSNLFSAPVFAEALRGKTAPIKAALLDQRVVAGLGNIYVCEALYRAGVSPRRKAGTTVGKRSDRLHRAIVDVLRDAIEAGGSSLKDFANTSGELGYFQHHFAVYGREGEPCGQCGATIERIVQSGRSTFFCRRCQR
ncbi:MAG: bifunctional DNA-formamidopyrimidine glycosylase/DNA-(apurinic or apyrimidinic site) lyase [Marinicaulis sp.]|nr:bifunctional DNA-formamidopyrimidine glycosylase/DNA-(apurinic or apyrimidinic site) lyase [Marinicaulis sp.]